MSAQPALTGKAKQLEEAMWRLRVTQDGRAVKSGRDAPRRRKAASILFFAATMLAIIWRFVIMDAE